MNKNKMKYGLLRGAVLVIAIVSGILVAQGEILEDMESDSGVGVPANSQGGTASEIVADPGKPGNRALKLSWSAHSGSHAAMTFQTPAIIAEEAGEYTISARVNLEQSGLECSRLALRVVDKGNETFQLRASLEKQGEPGWVVVKWIFDTQKPDTDGVPSWGMQVNGTVDFPVRLLGFAVDFKKGTTDGGSLLIDDISVSKSLP